MSFTAMPAPAEDRGYDRTAVPKHLRQQAEKGERALELMRQGKDPMDPANWQEAPPANPPAQPQGGNEAPPANPAPQPQQTSQEPPATPQQRQEGASADEQTWEQRYRSLEGQFRVQQRTLQGLEGELHQVRAALVQQERSPQPEQQHQELPAGQKGSINIEKLFSEEERNDWGPEWVQAMQRVADAVAKPLQARIDQLEGTTNTIAQREMRSARQVMVDGLSAANIDVDELNLSPDWLDWINKNDLGAGKPRRELIQEAWDRNEGARVEFFARQFLRDVRGAEPEAQPLKSTAKGGATAPQRKGLEDIAAPGKGKGTEPPRPADDTLQPETFTAKQYSEFYRDKSLGRLKMTPEEVVSWEQRLTDAYREGRIVPTPKE